MVKTKRTKEGKTKKTTWAFRPSVYLAFQKIAHEMSCSPNSIVDEFLESYVEEHKDLIEQYDKNHPEE